MEWHSNQVNESKGCVEETKSEGFSDDKVFAMLDSFQHSTSEMLEDIRLVIDVMKFENWKFICEYRESYDLLWRKMGSDLAMMRDEIRDRLGAVQCEQSEKPAGAVDFDDRRGCLKCKVEIEEEALKRFADFVSVDEISPVILPPSNLAAESGIPLYVTVRCRASTNSALGVSFGDIADSKMDTVIVGVETEAGAKPWSITSD